MKQSVFLFSCIITLLLSACSLPHQDTTLQESINTSGQQIQGKENIPDWIPKGYTGAIAVITEANSGDMIIQTGDQLLYRNEVYGFQILLGKEWKGGKICSQKIREDYEYDIGSLVFFLSGSFLEEKQDITSCRPLGYTTYSNLLIYKNADYFEQVEKTKRDKDNIHTLNLEIYPQRNNNQYHFIFRQGSQGEGLEPFVPGARCKTEMRPALDGVLIPDYICPDIEHSELLLNTFSSFDL